MGDYLERKVIRFLKKHQNGVLVLMATMFLFLIALGQVLPTQAALTFESKEKPHPVWDHVVTKVAISFADQKYHFFTRANSLQEALVKQGLILDQRDLVEPSPKTVLSGGELSVSVDKAEPVVVIDNNLRFETKACGETVGEILDNLKLKIHPKDIVMPPKDSVYLPGSEIAIARAKRVTIFNYDQEIRYYTNAGTVGDVLREVGIALKSIDQIKPSLNHSVSDRLVIHIFHKGEEILTEKVPIAYQVTYQDDPNLPVGEQIIVQQGRDGEKEQTLKVVRYNGRIVQYLVLREKVLKEPRSAIIKRGIKFEGVSETGYASWYDWVSGMTAAHRTLPKGTRVRVINLDNGRSCIVTIIDRGPWKPERIIDVSKQAAGVLGFISRGVALVRIEVLH